LPPAKRGPTTILNGGAGHGAFKIERYVGYLGQSHHQLTPPGLFTPRIYPHAVDSDGITMSGDG
jgi:hypothetical protein